MTEVTGVPTHLKAAIPLATGVYMSVVLCRGWFWSSHKGAIRPDRSALRFHSPGQAHSKVSLAASSKTVSLRWASRGHRGQRGVCAQGRAGMIQPYYPSSALWPEDTLSSGLGSWIGVHSAWYVITLHLFSSIGTMQYSGCIDFPHNWSVTWS